MFVMKQKNNMNKTWIYVIALAVLILLIMIVFAGDSSFNPGRVVLQTESGGIVGWFKAVFSDSDNVAYSPSEDTIIENSDYEVEGESYILFSDLPENQISKLDARTKGAIDEFMEVLRNAKSLEVNER